MSMVELVRFVSRFLSEVFVDIFALFAASKLWRELAHTPWPIMQLEHSRLIVFTHSLRRRCTSPLADFSFDISDSNIDTTCFEARRVSCRKKNETAFYPIREQSAKFKWIKVLFSRTVKSG